MTKKTVNLEAGTILFDFEDGTSETFDMARVPEAIRNQLQFHGASQKIGDSYASAGAAADPLAYAKESVRDTIAQLYAGTWRVGGGGGPRTSDLAVAVSRATGKTLDEMVIVIANLNDDQKKALRKQPKVAAQLAAIAAEKAAVKAAAAAKAAAEAPELSI